MQIERGEDFRELIQERMDGLQVSRMALADAVAKGIGSTQLNVTQRIARFLRTETRTMDLDLLIQTLKNLGLELRVEKCDDSPRTRSLDQAGPGEMAGTAQDVHHLD